MKLKIDVHKNLDLRLYRQKRERLQTGTEKKTKVGNEEEDLGYLIKKCPRKRADSNDLFELLHWEESIKDTVL